MERGGASWRSLSWPEERLAEGAEEAGLCCRGEVETRRSVDEQRGVYCDGRWCRFWRRER